MIWLILYVAIGTGIAGACHGNLNAWRRFVRNDIFLLAGIGALWPASLLILVLPDRIFHVVLWAVEISIYSKSKYLTEAK